MAGSGGSRGKGFRSALGNTWRVPRVDPEGLSGRLRKACGVAFGLTFGTRGMFRRKDRRVCFEGVSKGGFPRNGFGWLPGQVALSERRSGRGFGGVFKRRHSAGLREGFEDGRGLSGTRGTLRRGVIEGVTEREFRRVVFGRFHGGWLRSLDPRSTAPVGRLDRTEAR